MGYVAHLQEDLLIESFIAGDLFLQKMRALPGSTMENYYLFTSDEQIIHIAMDVTEATDIMLWLRDDATVEE